MEIRAHQRACKVINHQEHAFLDLYVGVRNVTSKKEQRGNDG